MIDIVAADCSVAMDGKSIVLQSVKSKKK